jgi:rhodanese-related sulfurtransferase
VRLRRWLAWAAALAGGAAPFAARSATVDIAALARTIANQDDHVSALELATWIRDHRAGLRVIDVRSADDYTRYHVPTAEHVPLDGLTDVRFADGDTIVLYSQAGVHAAQAWVFLRALGHRHVYFLRRGIDEWLDEVVQSPAELAARRTVRGNTC